MASRSTTLSVVMGRLPSNMSDLNELLPEVIRESYRRERIAAVNITPLTIKVRVWWSWEWSTWKWVNSRWVRQPPT